MYSVILFDTQGRSSFSFVNKEKSRDLRECYATIVVRGSYQNYQNGAVNDQQKDVGWVVGVFWR